MTRRVVITADDLGRDPVTDEVITGLVADGLVSATTLITVGAGADAAVQRMRDLGHVPRLHVTLSSERGLPGWHPLTAAPSLRDAAGAFPTDLRELAAHGEESEVIGEAEAQLTWLRARGIVAAAADSHAGTLYGMHGGRSWLEAALRWCAGHSLAFRLPRDIVPYFGGPLPAAYAGPHAAAVALADELGVAIPETIATNRRTAAEVGSYERLRDDWLGRLASLPEGVSELFLHPSGPDAVIGPDGTLRQWEARLLRDPVWHRALDAEAVEVVPGWWA